jgi:hypothetical protein
VNDIKLTDARAEVLRAIAAGEVSHHRSWGHDPDEDVWRPGGYGRKKVNGVVAFLKEARLIKLGPPVGPSMYAAQPWQLTEDGETWLARAGQESQR